MYLALENNILVCAAAAHKVLRYHLSPDMPLCLAGMAINSLPTRDWCILCTVAQIHPTSLYPHPFLHAGTHPTNQLVLVSLPASGCASCFPHPKGTADTNAVSCRGSAGWWASREKEIFREEEISSPSPRSAWSCAFPWLLQSCAISSPSSAVQTAFRCQLNPSAFTFAPALKLVTGYCSKDTFYALPPATPIIWIHIIKRLAAEIAHRKII